MKYSRKLVITVVLVAILVVSLFAAYKLNSKSPCDGTDKFGSDGLCTVDVEGGCRYDPKLGPKAALC